MKTKFNFLEDDIDFRPILFQDLDIGEWFQWDSARDGCVCLKVGNQEYVAWEYNPGSFKQEPSKCLGLRYVLEGQEHFKSKNFTDPVVRFAESEVSFRKRVTQMETK